jgi:hypothetical protein
VNFGSRLLDQNEISRTRTDTQKRQCTADGIVQTLLATPRELTQAKDLDQMCNVASDGQRRDVHSGVRLVATCYQLPHQRATLSPSTIPLLSPSSVPHSTVPSLLSRLYCPVSTAPSLLSRLYCPPQKENKSDQSKRIANVPLDLRMSGPDFDQGKGGTWVARVGDFCDPREKIVEPDSVHFQSSFLGPTTLTVFRTWHLLRSTGRTKDSLP